MNPAHLYRNMARQIVKKVRDQAVAAITGSGEFDPRWSLENAIVEALRVADQTGTARTQLQMVAIMREFDEENGTSSQ